jgi:hypothetical protein
MNFKISDDKTLNDQLNAYTDVQQARDTLVGAANGQPTDDAALKLCHAAALRIDALGFSPDDTGRAVWAYVTDLGLPQAKISTAVAACQTNLDHFPTQQQTASVDSHAASIVAGTK